MNEDDVAPLKQRYIAQVRAEINNLSNPEDRVYCILQHNERIDDFAKRIRANATSNPPPGTLWNMWHNYLIKSIEAGRPNNR